MYYIMRSQDFAGLFLDIITEELIDQGLLERGYTALLKQL